MSTNNNYQSGANSYNNWDFYNDHVDVGVKQGQFISSETTLVAAGFPDLHSSTVVRSADRPDNPDTPDADEAYQGTANQVYPIGLLETIGVQQSKQIQRIFELGSARSYFIPGRVIGSFNLGRTFFNGASLLRALYAYTSTVDPDNNTNESLMANLESVRNGGDQISLKRAAGHNNFLIDLTSDLFARPFGMAIYCKDSLGDTSNAFFLENCYVQGHQLSISAGSLIIMEGASSQFERAVPIKMVSVQATNVALGIPGNPALPPA